MVSYEQGMNLKISKKKRNAFDNLLTTRLLRNAPDLITYETRIIMGVKGKPDIIDICYRSSWFETRSEICSAER